MLDFLKHYQSRFKQYGSICQFLSVTYEIYQSVDDGFEIGGIFLDT